MRNKKLNILILFLVAFIIFITGCMQGGAPVNEGSKPSNEIEETEVKEATEAIKTTETTEATDETDEINEKDESDEIDETTDEIDEFAYYTDPQDVAEYIHTYNKLPVNFITKKEAIDLGWNSEKGNLWDVTDKMSIGGDRFGNKEGLLPNLKGRTYYECDVNYEGGFRGAERIVFSNDGLIFYTEDHYKSFTQLY